MTPEQLQMIREVSYLVVGITPAYKNQQIAKEKALEILERLLATR